MSDNWVVKTLENALATWDEKLAEIWALLTQSPEAFRGGALWGIADVYKRQGYSVPTASGTPWRLGHDSAGCLVLRHHRRSQNHRCKSTPKL